LGRFAARGSFFFGVRGLGLMIAAQGSQRSGASYAGDIGCQEAWDGLARDPRAQLVDCRTEAEWNFVGVPDLSELSRGALLIEWQRYPGSMQNPDFIQQVAAALAKAGHAKGSPVYFLCRSGARSRAAAIALTAAGYGPCFNIQEGFEGALDADRHRGIAAGWKADGLPWVQF
jgi:rhodanese-related sulfurtransferase